MRLPFMSSMLHLGENALGQVKNLDADVSGNSAVVSANARAASEQLADALRSLSLPRQAHGPLDSRPCHRETTRSAPFHCGQTAG